VAVENSTPIHDDVKSPSGSNLVVVTTLLLVVVGSAVVEVDDAVVVVDESTGVGGSACVGEAPGSSAPHAAATKTRTRNKPLLYTTPKPITLRLIPRPDRRVEANDPAHNEASLCQVIVFGRVERGR
jgi:hypothetical protein